MIVFDTETIDFLKRKNLISMLKETPFYQGSPDIRNANILFKFDELEMRYIRQSLNNPLDFFELCKFKNELGNPIILKDYQKKLLQEFDNESKISVLHSRQMGITMINAIYTLYYLFKNIGKNVCVFSDRQCISAEFIDKLKFFYKQTPFYLKPGIKKWNTTEISFDNGCRIRLINSNKPSVGYQIHFLIGQDILYSTTKSLENLRRNNIPIMNCLKDSKMIFFNGGAPRNFNGYWEYFIEDNTNP